MTSATCSRVCDIGAAATPAVILPLLGLQGVELTSGSHGNLSSLPGDAVLVRISFDGPPEYPYLYAHFRKVTGRIGAKPRRPLDVACPPETAGRCEGHGLQPPCNTARHDQCDAVPGQ